MCSGGIINRWLQKDFSATAEHKASYGWEMYELKDYLKSKEWFTNSVMTNEKWKDGYNGLGWSYAKLLELDSLDTENIGSIRTFHRGLIQPKDPWNSTDVHLEILAGLTFAYHAKGNNSEAVKFGSALIDSTLIGLNPSRWHSWALHLIIWIYALQWHPLILLSQNLTQRINI